MKLSEKKTPAPKPNALTTYLGAFPKGEALTQALIRRPAFSASERKHSVEMRLTYLSRLKNTLCPRPEYLRYAALFDRMLRDGYESRRNLIEGNQIGLYEARPGVTYKNPEALVNVNGSCILLAGVTGAGKTALVQLVQTMYPVIIDHGKITDGQIQMVQIPVLYVRCPSTGSLKSLARAFFAALDKHLSLQKFYVRRAQKNSLTADQLDDAIAQACCTHAIGTIIFDEFQDVIESVRASSRGIINYLLHLRDVIGVPLVYVGTYPMLDLFEFDGRSARRCAQGGGVLVPRFTRDNDPIWLSICATYWDHQWVQKPTKLTPSISRLLFQLSQGVPDFLHQIFSRAQEIAIGRRETVDESILQEAFDFRCPQLHPAVAALRSGKLAHIRAFKDLSHPWVEPRRIPAA